MTPRKLFIAMISLPLVGAALVMTIGSILLSSIPTLSFPLVQVRANFVPDGGTYFAVYEDSQGRSFVLGTTPRSRIFLLDLPLFLALNENGPRVYPYYRRYLNAPKVIAAPCSSNEKELQKFLRLLDASSRPEDHEPVDVINRVIERNKRYCKS